MISLILSGIMKILYFFLDIYTHINIYISVWFVHFMQGLLVNSLVAQIVSLNFLYHEIWCTVYGSNSVITCTVASFKTFYHFKNLKF